MFTAQSAPPSAKCSFVLEVMADSGRGQMRKRFANSEERATFVTPAGDSPHHTDTKQLLLGGGVPRDVGMTLSRSPSFSVASVHRGLGRTQPLEVPRAMTISTWTSERLLTPKHPGIWRNHSCRASPRVRMTPPPKDANWKAWFSPQEATGSGRLFFFFFHWCKNNHFLCQGGRTAERGRAWEEPRGAGREVLIACQLCGPHLTS